MHPWLRRWWYTGAAGINNAVARVAGLAISSAAIAALLLGDAARQR